MFSNEKPFSVLIIEDNPGDLLLFEEYLRESQIENVQMLKAGSIIQAYTILEKEKVDIAFLDLTLPDATGLHSFLAVNEQLKHTPIVVLSGLSDMGVARECIALGAQDYLLKDDLTAHLLEKAIHYSIERKRNLEKIRQTAEQYELIGKVTNDVIWQWDFITNKIKSPAKEFFDYNCSNIDFNISWWNDKVHPDDREQIFKIMHNFLQGKQDRAQAEYRFRCGDGSYRYVFNRALLLRDEKNTPYAVMGAMMDITERRLLQEELLNQQVDHQKQLNEATIIGQEKEKEQLSKELHDNVNQILASANLFLDIAMKDEAMRANLLFKCKETILQAIDEIRQLSHSLAPPSLGSLGFEDALKELVEELNTIGLFTTHVCVQDFEESTFDNTKKLILFRIVQEQINNIIKYAKATEVKIQLSKTGENLFLTIADNGVGFDVNNKHKGIGLKNIESRVSFCSGKMKLTSSIGKGTSLEITFPL